MERGPMALFGAIIAVGLGPAMWLGAQFGQVTLIPERPPAVTSVQKVEAPPGGAGAGDAPTEAEAIRTEPKSNNQPLNRPRNARPAATATTSPIPVETTEPAETPATSEPTESPEPPVESDPPTESTTPPDDPPPDDEPDVPSQPSADPDSGQTPAQASAV